MLNYLCSVTDGLLKYVRAIMPKSHYTRFPITSLDGEAANLIVTDL